MPAGAQHDHPHSTDSDTIMSGVVFLYTSGSWPLALIVLIASVIVPLGELLALVYLLITVQRGSLGGNHERTRLYRMVGLSGAGRCLMLRRHVHRHLVHSASLMSVAPVQESSFAAVVVLDYDYGRVVRPSSHFGCEHNQR